ncbi:tetratricopeptide repeat protein [Listeria sp. FSL L7-0091]|uniref:Tetratricopeptide repeat protein n=1 Tax=Listeria farberi TaxID=2713500 RepID=A0ABR6SNT7_9LIST|nr:tetratricopeptide repeat protein [Listeria farberi]MBC1375940.1 tetratricopeptide repeat protein [Listeria farberi]MBC1382041.1 tetratricopeptide repeat protein [Listeria farberi]MBC2261915.1 tetratricopeptide repeat protein [Listeria farberi]MBC2268213.1 tetratricopeptide repeat protein [Listeria farberi]
MFNSKGRKKFEEGLYYLSNNRPRKALEAFNEVPKKSKYYNETLANIMCALNDVNDYEASKEIFPKIKEVYPTYYIAATNQMQALLETGYASQSVRLFRSLKQPEVIDDNVLLFWNAAVAANRSDENELVIELCKILEQLMPDHEFLDVWRGIAYYNLEDYDKAEKLLLRFANFTGTKYRVQLSKDKWMQKALYTLMLLYNRNGNNLLAKKFEAEYEAQKEYEIAVSYFQQGDFSKAMISLEKVPPSVAISENVLNDSIMCYVHLKKYEKALELFKQINKDSNIYYLAVINYVAALNGLERYEEVLAMESVIPQTFKQYNIFLHNLVNAAEGAKDYNTAINYCERILEIEEEEKYRYKKGLFQFYLEQYDTAIETLNEINSWHYQDDYVDVVYLFGCCYERLEEQEKAEEFFNEAYSLEHSSATAMFVNDNGERQQIHVSGRKPFKPEIK